MEPYLRLLAPSVPSANMLAVFFQVRDVRPNLWRPPRRSDRHAGNVSHGLTRAKVAIFVDGCFWHSCPVHGTRPTRNPDYWLPNSIATFSETGQDAALAANGWQTIRIWEHESPTEAAERVRRIVRGLQPSSTEGSSSTS